MNEKATPAFTVAWRPAAEDGDDLTLSLPAASRRTLKRFASRLDAPPAMLITAPDGRDAVSTPRAVLAWSEDRPLPETDAEWRSVRTVRGDGTHAVDMLEAFLAWTMSRGLIDEAARRRISRSVQLELAGEADGRRD